MHGNPVGNLKKGSKTMKVYRYENKNTGSGPFLSFEGLNPADGKIYNNGYLYGCKT
jgi:hypothetical protein